MTMVVRDGIYLPARDNHFHGKVTDYQKPIYDKAMEWVAGTNGVAIDAGAHVGIFTRRMAPFLEVIAFEPDAENYACLVENVAEISWVRPIRGALGRADGWGKTRVDAAHNSGAKSFVPCDDGDVRIFTIDRFIGTDVKLIKIDTQGAELDILMGANMTLRRDKPVLIVEMPDTETTVYLCSLGYKPVDRVNKDQIFVAEG